MASGLSTIFIRVVVVAVIGAGCSNPADTGPGVPDNRHWAFKPPQRPATPAVARANWPRNPIDNFVLAALEAAKWEPAEEADRYTLARRVSLDLTGLPPTPATIEAFVKDPASDAYDKLVDRLLLQPSYGEHRARFWLDNARYADTHGLHRDNYRSIWPYRDWVIRAFNDNMPFDRFTVEQLAGDLLQAPTESTRVATGFHRCAVSTNEMGVILEEYEAIYAQDRVETTAGVWLGLTVGCARCHDHKFDPISQREFYQLAAFFRNTTEPVMNGDVPDPAPAIDVGGQVRSLVMEERPTAASAHVLARGQYDQKGELVGAGVPKVLPAFDNYPRNRLGLARWLTAPQHPLTSRVIANRLWAQIFGTGIVATVENFGVIGQPPSNQPLLDWLAVELRESGWNVKRFIKLLVTSATYRQSSAASPEKFERDPDNRKLSRGPRFRMDGEMIRDLALAAGGLLVAQVGGPSVKPYQPAGVWEAVAIPGGNTVTYEQDHGAALYRRSLYTFWKRSAPPPALEIFNAPTRETASLQRERTNTPLQALALLNDPQIIEAARRLALVVIGEAGPDMDRRLDRMALRVLARPLDQEEKQILRPIAAALGQHYQQNQPAAEALVKVGEMPGDPQVPIFEQAAWTLVAGQFLNLDEALNK